MAPTMTRRELLQWLGGTTAGLVLSPAPFALIDDLTIATQTRGRPVGLPTGSLDRFRTRCPGCPAACAIDVLTVGNQPYLCVPTPGRQPRGACALLPALHQLRLHRRLTQPIGRGRGGMTCEAARDEVLQWVEATGEPAQIAALDFGPASRGETPLSVLAASIEGAIQVSGSTPRAPLGALARRLALGDDQELALDPARIRRIVPIGPATRPDDPALRQLRSRVEYRHDLDPAGVLVISRRDGVQGRLDPAVERLAAEANLALGALGKDAPIVVRRRLRLGGPPDRGLDSIADHSLRLLFVDVSRAWQVVPWRRLRRKLVPGAGRLVVFTPWSGAAIEHADLVLPSAAPLEIEEFAGGDDRFPELRLSLCRPLTACHHALLDPLRLARAFDPDALDPVETTLRALVADPAGTLFDPGAQERSAPPSDADALLAELRRGREWHGPTLPPPRVPDQDSTENAGVASAASVGPDAPRVRIEAAVVAGAGIPLPPVLAKLSHESRLVAPAGTVRAHPDTLARLGLEPGCRRRLRTNRGDIEATLAGDRSVERGCFVIMAGFEASGFATDYREGPDPLGRLDVDPAHDRPDEWTIEEVVS